MDNIKYICDSDYCKFELEEKFKYDISKKYPIFTSKVAKHYHIDGKELSLLSYPLLTLKSESKEIIDKLKLAWDNGYSDFLSDIEGKKNSSSIFEFDGEFYLILRNSNFDILDENNKAIFPNGISENEQLGVMDINEKLKKDILELDQNLQSTNDIDLILELMQENTDMAKYIEFIRQNIKSEHLDEHFFFDEYIYNLFSKKYIEVLEDLSPYKNDPYGRKGIERFIDQTLKGEYNDECKCCNV